MAKQLRTWTLTVRGVGDTTTGAVCEFRYDTDESTDTSLRGDRKARPTITSPDLTQTVQAFCDSEIAGAKTDEGI